jgi:uncharacterized protein YjiK
LAALFCALAGVACAEEAPARLDAYDFDTEPAKRWKLPKALKEISGLGLTADGRLLAHDDEVGIVYELDPMAGKIVKQFTLHPPTKADFEGIAAAGADLFLLISDGRIVRTREGSGGEKVAFKVWRTPVQNQCDFEGLVDLPDGTLVVGCKTFNSHRNQPPTLFSLDPSTGTANAIAINSKHDLRPTAVEHDPTTDHLLILSSKKRRIVELTRAGTVVASHKLDKNRHQQPEGLALADDGTLFVADEGGKGKAHLAIYRPRP